MWMSSHGYTSSPLFYASFSPDQRETGCYTWHDTKAVTLTGDAPLSKARGPGLSVSKIEPLGGLLSPFCLSSRRSLGPGLLLGQGSRTHFFSDFVGSLVHQDHRNPYAEFASHRHNGDSCGHRTR